MYRIVNRRKRILTRLADLAGWTLFGLPRRLVRRRPVDPAAVGSLLVIRTAYVGDVAMTLPMLPALRRGFPRARIGFLTSTACAPLLEGNPCVDEVFVWDPPWFYGRGSGGYRALVRKLRAARFDLVIEARADLRELLAFVAPLRCRWKVSYGVGGGAWLLTHTVPYTRPVHKVDYHLDLARVLGCPADGALDARVRLGEAEEARVEALLRACGVAGRFIAVHPGSRLPLKQWPPARFAEAADALAGETGLPVVLLGAPSERETAAAVADAMQTPAARLDGKTSLRELYGVLARAAMLVCNDSAPMHLASAAGTPVAAVFGPSTSWETGPWNAPCRVVEKDYACRAACDESHCAWHTYNACLRAVETADVLEAARALLQDTAHVWKPT